VVRYSNNSPLLPPAILYTRTWHPPIGQTQIRRSLALLGHLDLCLLGRRSILRPPATQCSRPLRDVAPALRSAKVIHLLPASVPFDLDITSRAFDFRFGCQLFFLAESSSGSEMGTVLSLFIALDWVGRFSLANKIRVKDRVSCNKLDA